ncbi:aminotransferase class IV [Fundidesulfovibrio putealis]|uniref:aminotransferase class IV n=1 Tax=Fundidesulfovibrio putealis TaxID=270496 RepID=UPI0003FC5BE7|nr:aminotransferase class IV [Fundidesulfovibrio putealis]
MEILGSKEYLERMLAAPRPGAGQVLAFYEHRIGAVCKDPELMLMPWDDHLVHRGDGVFETIKWVDGRVYLLDEHLARMGRSGKAIGLEPPCPWEEVREIVLEIGRATGVDKGLFRMLLGRGPGGFGIDPSECPTPSLYIAAYQYTPKPAAFYEKGVTAFRTSIPAKQSYLATIKSIDYLPNVLMKKEAAAKGKDFPVCFDAQGFLAEGATENIALVDASGCICVPNLNNALSGTTLLRVLELAKGEIPHCYKTISEEDIYVANEMIVLGTTAQCISIVEYNGRPVGDGKPGPVSKRLLELLKKDLVEYGVPL